MSNRIILPLLLVICELLFSCQDQALLRKKLYNLEQTIIEEKLDLREEQYTYALNFIAPKTILDAKIILAYPNISQSEEINDSDFNRITSSLRGFSLELYATDTDALVHSTLVTQRKKPHIDELTVSLLLGNRISLIKNTSYELRITMPSKKNTQDRYTMPVLVVGTP